MNQGYDLLCFFTVLGRISLTNSAPAGSIFRHIATLNLYERRSIFRNPNTQDIHTKYTQDFVLLSIRTSSPTTNPNPAPRDT